MLNGFGENYPLIYHEEYSLYQDLNITIANRKLTS